MPQRIDVPGMGVVEFPDGMNDDQIAAAIKQNMPQRSGIGDFFKSIPRGVLGGLSHAGSALGQATAHEMGQPDLAAEIPNQEQTTQHLERNVTGDLPKPEGRAGRFGTAIGETLGNPASYVGPGGSLLKIGGAVLSGAGGEAAGQATEGSKYEGAARLAGALAGGVTAAKAFGPTQAKAVVPTGQELKDIGASGGRFGGYEGAAKSGLELDPAGVASWAASTRAAPNVSRFTGGDRGTAPKTIGLLDDLQAVPKPPPGGNFTIRTQNIDDIRSNLRDIAGEVQPTQGGAVKSTPDAVAAQRVLEHLNTYTENIPASHVVAGDTAAYVRATKEANANYAAGSRASDFDARLTKAERATDRSIAGSIDQQIKSKAGQMIDRGARGLDPAEKAQLSLIETGTPASNFLRQLGRGGAGVIPLMGQLAAAPIVAATTGGVGTAAQAGLAAALYAARKGSEAITKNRAEKLVEMLAKRSPEYESRVANLPQVSSAPNKAAIVRALLGQ